MKRDFIIERDNAESRSNVKFSFSREGKKMNEALDEIFFPFRKIFSFFEKRERYYVNAFITFYLSSHLFIFSMRVKIDLIDIRDKKKNINFYLTFFFFFFVSQSTYRFDIYLILLYTRARNLNLIRLYDYNVNRATAPTRRYIEVWHSNNLL